MAASDKSVAVSFTTDFSSDSTVSDGWQELTKSDYAKVIFSDLLCNAASGTVECKFQITDNVHEDPNDYVGLFRIGYEDLSQCLVSKMLSQTKCEDDGKLQRCVFTANELPCLDDGFYQFLYVTRDQEVCGASMPFQIKMSPFQLKESSSESGSAEKMDGGFLLVSNEKEKKVKGESNEQEKTSVQRSSLSEQKKEEIAAWVSQNPDYYSLIEQIKEHTFTIDALQQSKDLAMKEVAQLYEILNTQNGELIQLKNMLAAYEEKIKMSQSLQEEKNNEIIQMRNVVTAFELQMEGECGLQEMKNAELNEMKKSLTAYEEKIRICELIQNEKDKQLSQMKTEYEASLEASLALQDQQRTEINDLKKELEEMRELQKATECHQVTAETGHSMENLIQKAQNFVRIVSDAIKDLDFTDEDEVEKFFQLKIQLLIILSKMTRATDLANICDRNGLHKTIHSIMEKDMKENSCADSKSCAPENGGSLLTNSNTNAPEVEKPDFPASTSAEIPNSSEKEPTSEDAPKEVAQIIPCKNSLFELEVLVHQIRELPRLDVINTDTAMTLKTDRPLDVEDVTVINRLTEKIIKRGFKLYETIELADDSSSESGSDVSEVSECSLIKKDLLCVGRVMDALSSSSLSSQASLEQLVVVESEEDKNLICKKEWNVLLQKCALHYQIEILLEHIEKQKDGMKKLSDKICELLTKCMLLKDEARDAKAVCETLQAVVDKKDMNISSLKAEVEFKNSILTHFCSAKEEMEARAEFAEQTIEDYEARIVEASNLYKEQYTQIQKLSKKLKKYKSVIDKTKASKEESSVTLSGSSKTTHSTSSFEVIQTDSVQNVNDSDTGEHMFEKATLVSFQKYQSDKSCTPDRAARQPTMNPSLFKKTSWKLDPSNPPKRSELDDVIGFFAEVFDEFFELKSNTLEEVIFQSKKDKRIHRNLENGAWTIKDYRNVPKFCLCCSHQASYFQGPTQEMHSTESGERISSTSELKPAPEGCTSPQVFSNDEPVVKHLKLSTAAEESGMKSEAIQEQIDPNEGIKPNTVTRVDPHLQACADLLPSTHEVKNDHSTTDQPNTEYKSHQTASVFSDFASYEHFQEIMRGHFVSLKEPVASRNSQQFSISCYFCKKIFRLDSEDHFDLMNHFENEHCMKICPVCGQLFEDAIPPKYFHIHINKHFENE